MRPEWQKKDRGTRFLEEVARIADERGVEACVDSSREGRGLYEWFGWKDVRETVVELGVFRGGGEG